ncbi:hypothetical protein NG791_20030 [Laspinema sp. D1]|uniref:hypothetical protein n=1 Tax=Laspinema palackyanum TaxID=3231601 RepID=UPI003499898A|nr:hypothetical protein [Laspinema sp. D2b]
MKKHWHQIVGNVLFAGLLVGLSGEAIASGILRVPASSARGEMDAPVSIGLIPGQGVNISVIPTGEVIKRVWLDNPSFATVDVDGCLEGLNNQSCDRPGARVVHLRQIEPIDFPGLPSAQDSLLTLVTQTPEGSANVYVFRLYPSQTHSHPVVKIELDSSSPESPESIEDLPIADGALDGSPSSRLQLASSFEHFDLSQFQLGVNRALNQQLLDPQGALAQRLNDFINRVETGQIPSNAARAVGLSDALINRILQFGAFNSPVIEWEQSALVKAQSIL